ncbi:MAG: amidohydrolase family protein [Planctomycetaceae bacterium]
MSALRSSGCLRARWMFPVDQPPLAEGVIEIENGRIVRLGSGGSDDANNLGDVAIIPGLVNAHTHLEFSNLTCPIGPAAPFTDWIRGVIAARRPRAGSISGAIDQGLQECAAAGTTLVGEIATGNESVDRFADTTSAGVVFRELLGTSGAAVEQQLEIARRHLTDGEGEGEGQRAVIRGLSPHAPYSVSAELLERCVQLAVEEHVPVAMHLAETPEERELLGRGSGQFVALLKDLGAWRGRFWMPEGTIQSYLDVLSQAPRALIIHGNDLTSAEIEFLATQPQMAVVYCPRTHRYFDHPPHPWRTLLERGVRVALGTDSRASNPDLSLWNDVLFLRRHFDDVPAATLLELATIHGAAALGLAQQTGTLTPGKSADLAVITCCDDALKIATTHPTEALLHPGNRAIATMRRGRWIRR